MMTNFDLAVAYLKQSGWTVEAKHGRTLHYRYTTECGKQSTTPYWAEEVAFRAYRNGKEWNKRRVVNTPEFSDEGGWLWAQTERKMWREVVEDKMFWVLYPNSEHTEFQPLQWFERRAKSGYELVAHGDKQYTLKWQGREATGTLVSVVLSVLVSEVASE
jgi:hypothetical protein